MTQYLLSSYIRNFPDNASSKNRPNNEHSKIKYFWMLFWHPCRYIMKFLVWEWIKCPQKGGGQKIDLLLQNGPYNDKYLSITPPHHFYAYNVQYTMGNHNLCNSTINIMKFLKILQIWLTNLLPSHIQNYPDYTSSKQGPNNENF